MKYRLRAQGWNRRGVAPRSARLAAFTGFRLEALEPRALLSAITPDHDHDHDLHVTPLPDAVALAQAATLAALAPQTATLPLSQTFLLHSRPTASKRIYLDFDGATTSGTIWNSGGNSIVTPAFNADGDAGTFSDAELQRIQYIFQRVAEDFSPFDVDVTTQEPAAADLMKSGTGDASWGVRIVIGGNGSWFGSAGGVAYINSFNWSSDTPAFVFSSNLANSEKYVAEAITHEAGHTLGLQHDGTASSGYYTGQGSGETGWAPIMGVGYYQNLTQWSKGQYAGANNPQDDLTILATQNGFGYRADDHGGLIAAATPLTVAGTAVGGAGVIERNTDSDVFSFTTSAATVSLEVRPFERGPNLDVYAELLNAAGGVVVASNPIDLLSANLSATLPAGTYYVRVAGTGKGDPLTTGYSNYASLGQYTVSGTIGAAVTPPPSLSVGDVTVNEASGSAVFTVTLSQASASTVTVHATTANDTASAGGDYTARTFALTFAPGVTTQTVSVPIVNDSLAETTERFFLNLSGAAGATITDGQGVATIQDNDAVTISVSDATVIETNPGPRGKLRTTVLSFVITLSQPATQTVMVGYATAGGTATAGADFLSKSGSVGFSPGQTTQSVSITVIGDTRVEGAETLFLNLSAPIGAAILDGQAVGTIFDNDAASRADVIDSSRLRGMTLPRLLANAKKLRAKLVVDTAGPAAGNVGACGPSVTGAGPRWVLAGLF